MMVPTRFAELTIEQYRPTAVISVTIIKLSVDLIISKEKSASRYDTQRELNTSYLGGNRMNIDMTSLHPELKVGKVPKAILRFIILQLLLKDFKWLILK